MLEVFGYLAVAIVALAVVGTIIDVIMSKIDKKYRKNF